MAKFKEALNNVKAFVFDIDGVFTNGTIQINHDGSQLRSMNVKDGYAIHFASKKRYPIAIISGGKCESLISRFNDLGVTDIYLQSKNKLLDFEDFIAKYNINPQNVLFMGDDIPDYPLMKTVGVATCPADAVPEIKSVAHYISDKAGGFGCVRDIVEQTLKTQKNWMDTDAFIW